jgi:hypothetical protein
MRPFDEQAAHLPPPRADEPANLRREIIDELSDHLTCARKREQLAGGPQTEEAIQHRVLNRFGDPAAVARKLWLDWMWEKIMTQRILVGMCVLLALVTCAALAFAWVSLNRQHDLIANLQLTSQAQLEHQQKQMQEQQRQFERLLVTAQNNKPASDWNPVELRFVKGKEDGPPAEGIDVHVSIEATESGIPPMHGVSNKDGIVRFERVRYGSYDLSVRNSAQERFSTSFTLQPGEGLTRTIVCPDPPAEPAHVTPRIAWPDDLTNRPLWFRFQDETVHRTVAGKVWKANSMMRTESGDSYNPSYDPLVTPNGDIAAADNSTFGGGSITRLMPGQPAFNQISYLGSGFGRSRGRLPKLTEGLLWPGTDYRIPIVEILLPDENLTSLEELLKSADALPAGRGGYGGRQQSRSYFHRIGIDSADWSYRIEPGADDQRGILWLTPTADAIKKVRTALAEIEQFREAAEKAAAEAESERRESSKTRGELEKKSSETPEAAKE